jgi:hypothetical protein
MTMDINAALRDERDRCLNRARLISQLIGEEPAGSVKRVVPSATTPAERQERVSKEAIEKALAQIVKLLEKHSEGLRSEQIRSDLSMPKKLFQYAAHLGKTTDQLAQTGERRSTVYSLPGARETDIDASKMLEHIGPSKAQREGRVVKKKRRA